MAKFTKLSFCQKLLFWYKCSSSKFSLCLYYVGKVSDSFSKSSGISWFPRACTIWAQTKPLLSSKVLRKWLSSKCCHFVKMYSYGIKLLHANVQCVYIVYTKYKDVSLKAVEWVEFPIYALPMDHYTLQETWLEFLWCQERLQWKLGMPRIGVADAEIKIDEKGQRFLFI